MESRFNISYILGISFISALGGYLFGFDFAVITGGLPFLADGFGLDAGGEGGITASLAIGAMVGCMVTGAVSDKYGRNPLMLFGSGGLAVLYIVIASIIKNTMGSVLSPFVLAAIGTYALSLAPVTWVIIAEIFPNRIRGRAIAIATVALWGAYSILVFTFPIIAEKLDEHVPFYAYAVICILGFLFIRFKLTETKGKSLEEVEKELTKRY